MRMEQDTFRISKLLEIDTFQQGKQSQLGSTTQIVVECLKDQIGNIFKGHIECLCKLIPITNIDTYFQDTYKI